MSNPPSVRLIAPMFWIVLILSLLELGVEARAHRRGFSTLLFGSEKQSAETLEEEGELSFGPRGDFPWRSEILVPGSEASHPLIWIASSSHAQDSALPVQALFPNRLAEWFRARGESWKVINASRAGSSMRDQIRLATAEGPRWRPQTVVLYQMSNDITRYARQEAGEIPADPPDAWEDELVEADAQSEPSVAWADELLESTTLFALLKTNLSSVVAQGRVLLPGLEPSATEAYRRDVLRFIEVWRALGARPVLCSFATSHRRRDLPDIPMEIRKSIFRFNMHLSMEGWLDTVDEWNRVLREIAEQEDIQFVDVAAELDGRSDLFRDFVHFTPEGHEVVAEILGRALAEREASR